MMSSYLRVLGEVTDRYPGQYFVLSHIPLWSSFYLCKASLLAAYLTLFEEFMKKRRFFLWVTIAYNVVAYVVSLAALLFICEPERYW